MKTFIKSGFWTTKKTGATPRGWLDLTKLIKDNSGGTSGNNVPVIEVTYSELLNLKNTSSLVKGQNYLLTDYETTYIQPITYASKSSGVIEPLIITAPDVNKGSGVIEPLIITATDVNKLHNVCKSTLYPQDIVYYEITGDIGNGYGTEGFTKGKIYRRIDTQKNNDIGTDWRHVKYDRNGVDKLLFEDYTDVYNNTIKTYYLFDNVLGNYFYNNTIGNYFSNNTIGDGFYNNTIGSNFSNNTIGYGFFNNTTGDGFQDNTIGDYFSNNTIGNYFYNNTIGNYFSNNTIGDGFQDNGNTSTHFTSNNTEFRNHISNATSSTEIQNENIDVVVFKSPNGTKKQRYYDDSNNLVINNL